MGSGASQQSQANLQEKGRGDGRGAKKVEKPEESSDLMISYSHADKTFMNKLKDGLEKNDIKVWVDMTGLQAGVDFLSKIGQAIIDSKIFVTILSENSIKSRYCQDELALAYVSNKSIYPVNLCEESQLFPQMDTGMKLQLARFSWNPFLDDEKFEENLELLVKKMKKENEDGEETKAKEEKESDDGDRKLKRQNTVINDKSRRKINKKLNKQMSFNRKLSILGDQVNEENDFWNKYWKGRSSVLWKDFEKAVLEEYKVLLNQVFSDKDCVWLMGVLRRELETPETGAVFQEQYTSFCTIDDEMQSFWSCIQLQAVESYTMKEVFNMDSSVRVQAIENLGKFRSPAVIEALKDLLVDKDNNVRSVAAISLARTGANDKQVVNLLIDCLKEKDRLVRESACLALGHLRAEEAVDKLVHLWRNDFISHVREAAQIALEQIGGEEANQAMHITKVLSDEIRMLTDET